MRCARYAACRWVHAALVLTPWSHSSVVGQFVSLSSTKAFGSAGPGFGYSKESRQVTIDNGKRLIQQLASQLRLTQVRCVQLRHEHWQQTACHTQRRAHGSISRRPMHALARLEHANLPLWWPRACGVVATALRRLCTSAVHSRGAAQFHPGALSAYYAAAHTLHWPSHDPLVPPGRVIAPCASTRADRRGARRSMWWPPVSTWCAGARSPRCCSSTSQRRCACVHDLTSPGRHASN